MGPEDLRTLLRDLRRQRVDSPERSQARERRRSSLGPTGRKQILASTRSRCHICGGDIADGQKWHADHVRAHSGGGEHAVDNYLPAHALCNNYRWDYLPEEFQLILKLGVRTRTQIERGTPVGKTICRGFARYESARERRRSNK